MIKYLFLDIDGVLNTHGFDPAVGSGTIDAGKVGRLNSVLLATGAKIVLSSAWRYLVHRGDMTLTGLDWLLKSHGVLKDSLVGITREDTMAEIRRKGDATGMSRPVPNERGLQISEWLTEHPGYHGYLVIDDLDLGIRRLGHPIVLTDGGVGLTYKDMHDAIAILNGGA